jgi:3-dehydroquinate synthase
MEITVHLGARSYPVFIETGCAELLAGRLRELFSRASRFALVTNVTLASLYENELSEWERQLGLLRHEIADGERYKTLETCSAIVDTFLGQRLDRQAVVCAFGGGVVGDIAGFAASICLRGIEYVQIPTTLLAMVDSSVGGKTAVNHRSGKNLIGAFHQPRMVWIDTSWLRTLSEREFTAGSAELFKYAFIGGREMFDFIEGRFGQVLGRDPEALAQGIEKSIRIKASVVERDEREAGLRALLNFGHTFAHAIERLYNYETVLHGEAVMVGIRCAVDLGMRVRSVPARSRARYESIIEKLPAVRLPSKVAPEALYGHMFSDKKVRKRKLRFVLPAAPGESVVRDDVPETAIMETLRSVLGNEGIFSGAGPRQRPRPRRSGHTEGTGGTGRTRRGTGSGG